MIDPIRCRCFLVLLVGLLSVGGRAQAQSGGSASKVAWTVQGDTLSSGAQGRVTLRASIADGWKMYAPDSPPPTRGVAVETEAADGLTVDSLHHTGAKSGHDPNFGVSIRYFQDTAQLSLPVSVALPVEAGRRAVTGTITFMVCTDEICLPPATESFATAVQVRPENGS